jgi:putative SOS response-associated peptidase YedK
MMCGRFTLTADPADLQAAFEWVNFGNTQFAPRFNIAPTQPIPVVTNAGSNQLDFFTWGLVPFWAKDPSIASRMINARAETLAEKASFKNAFKRRRCLILGDGFYEWKKIPGEKIKQPIYIHLKGHQPFAFAGLWEEWNSTDGSQILSATIITTEPNELISPIHNRMPVILPKSDYMRWLKPGEVDVREMSALLRPYDAEKMETYPVSRAVNNPINDSSKCILPLGSIN